MRNSIVIFLMALAVCCPASASATKSSYFPPPGYEWETLGWKQLGWNEQALDRALSQARNYFTTGLIILQDGKIVIERYWPLPTSRPPEIDYAFKHMLYRVTRRGFPVEDVGPVQDSFVAVLAGIARDKGLIRYDDPVNKYLGDHWAHLTPAQSREITIRHLMAQTSGLTDSLEYASKPGTGWHYNPAAGQVLLRLLSKASGMDDNTLTHEWLLDRLGMAHTIWLERAGTKTSPPTMGLVTTTRDLARFGLLVLHQGRWKDERVLSKATLGALLKPAQPYNPNYGMLWWLNGSAKSGKRIADAPDDMIEAADRSLDRYVYILPARGIVIVRIGLFNPAVPIDVDAFEAAWWKNLANVFPAAHAGPRATGR